MANDHRGKLASIKRFDQLIAYLRDEMGWPIAQDSFEEVDDLFYDFTADELGIDPKTAAKIESIKRLRPLSVHQPWGIFFVKFEPKKLPVVALRRILGQVALKKRPSANSAERTAWAADDLLFISNYGEGSERQITFAHFAKAQDGQNLPTLKVLGWDNFDTALHLDAVAKELTEHLSWPADDTDAEKWRKDWRGAFTLRYREVVTTSKELSIRLAELARDIRDRIKSALRFETDRGQLTKLMKAFQTSLVHDLDADGFADMYAQTIAYGLLSARIADPHKKTVDDFAGHMRTNPFLRELMETFLKVGGRRGKAGGPGIDFDELGVTEVVQLLDDADMEAVVRDFGDKNPQEDPVIHFYELFLKEYDAKKRTQRGVFYTPRPVVSYIVRSVDELLRTEFGLEDGLADTATWGEMGRLHTDLKIPVGTPPDQAFVQILDPATGTGTFLVEVIDIIHKTMVAKWKAQGHGEKKIAALWNEYVPEHLLKRLHAYELLMAPYAIAHLKVGLKLYETGYRFGSEERARIYLTNALEPAQDFSGTFEFAIPALAHEAQAVNEVKRKQRFTVVLGNPPYSGHSANNGQWIGRLLHGIDLETSAATWNYFEADGASLGERNPKYLNDDYVKFIRLAQSRIDRTGTGILAFITNHGYLDNPTFRGMRQSLLGTFQRTKVLDLHGNANKNERALDGSADESVFDIRQGVAIGIFVSKPTAAPTIVIHGDLRGTRERKFSWLVSHSQGRTEWKIASCTSPTYGFYVQDDTLRLEYEQAWPINRCFERYALGSKSHRDDFAVAFDVAEAQVRLDDLRNRSFSDKFLREKYGITDTRDWNLADARKRIPENAAPVLGLYRPFDFRYLLLGDYAYDWPRPEINDSLLRSNVALAVTRQTKEDFAVLALSKPSGQHKLVAAYDSSYVCPLFLFPNAAASIFGGGSSRDERHCNLSRGFVAAVAAATHPDLQSAAGELEGRTRPVSPEAEFHYIYGIAHSPAYRSRYSEFLKLDFPRIPVPGTLGLYREVCRLGAELVALHLVEAPRLNEFITIYFGPKSPEVGRVGWANDTIWLDAAATKKGQPATAGTIGFRGVPEAVWNFRIGGYQVCEKWLKDRKGRTLSKDDIAHYQKIVVAISETLRLMQEIDEVIEQHGGWPGAFQTGEAQSVEPPLLMVAEPEAKYGSDEEDDPQGGAGRDQGRISFQ